MGSSRRRLQDETLFEIIVSTDNSYDAEIFGDDLTSNGPSAVSGAVTYAATTEGTVETSLVCLFFFFCFFLICAFFYFSYLLCFFFAIFFVIFLFFLCVLSIVLKSCES